MKLMNKIRAERGEELVSLYESLTKTDREDALGDLLCDLMHWAKENKIDFEASLACGIEHHEFETTEEANVLEDGSLLGKEVL